MKPITLLLAALITTMTAAAHTLQGTVVDAHDRPLVGASVVLFAAHNDSVPVTGTGSNEQGKFMLQAGDGNYRLRISFLGMKSGWQDIALYSDIALPPIKLAADTIMAREVTITAQFISHKSNGNLFVKVPGNPLARNSDGMEMLYKIPGVWGLSIYGKEIAAIYVNGRRLTIPRSGWTDYLKGIDASMIESYEFVPVAGSEIDGNTGGAILYLSLVKAPEAGANITLGASGSYRFKQTNIAGGPSLNMTVGYKKFQSYTYFDSSFSRDDFTKTINERQYYTDSQNPLLYKSERDQYIQTNSYIVDQSFAYEINKNNNIELSFSGMFFPDRLITQLEGTTFNNTGLNFGQYACDTTRYDDTYYGIYGAYNLSIDTLGTRLKASVEYTYLHQMQGNTYSRIYAADSIHVIDISSRYSGYGISPQIDFVYRPRNKVYFNAGLHYLYTNRDINFRQQETGVDDVLRPSDSQENIYAAYGNVVANLSRMSARAGIRIEYCDGLYFYRGGAHASLTEWTFLPSASLHFQLNRARGHSLALSYSARSTRPSPAFFDPTVYKQGEYNYVSGNGNLKSSYTHVLQLRQTLWNKFNVSLNGEWTVRNIDVAYERDTQDPRIYHHRPINYGSIARYAINLSYGSAIFPWWYINAHTTVGVRRENSFNYGIVYSWGLNANVYNQFSLPHGWAISLSGGYNKSERRGALLYDDSYSLSASVSKGFFNNALKLNCGINNIICKETPVNTVYMDNYIQHQYVDRSQRQVYISLRYTFNVGKKDINNLYIEKPGSSRSRF